MGDIADSDVDEGQDEGRQGEGGETERCGITKLAVGRRIETGLEVTTEGSKTMVFVGFPVCERIATYCS